MAEPRDDPRRNDSRDIARVTQEVASRLRGSGVDVYDNDSPEELVRLLDAVEAFERSVQRHGGDLMVDEPPDDVRGEPTTRYSSYRPGRPTNPWPATSGAWTP